MSRRAFVGKSVALTGLVATETDSSDGRAPVMMTPKTVPPLVISSGNGNRYRNGGSETVVERAFRLITEGNDVLESLIAGVNIVELDPDDSSVGFGGLPNADGVVQLDSCCMHGPRRRAGGVAALEGIRTPSRVAHAVLEQTDHHLLVGEGAQRFAQMMGFEIEEDLNTEKSRTLWLEWKRRIDPEHYLDPKRRTETGYRAGVEMVRDGMIEEDHLFGTINCNGINANGEICGVTTTSGLSWKIPGRVGDSPILGAGLYVDGEVGAAGSTGRGEANLFGLCSFLIVEGMRNGKHPKDAGMDALQRVRRNTVEKRLLNHNGLPNFGLSFYILNRLGEYAAVGLYGSEASRFAVCTENGAQSLPIEPLLEGSASD